MARTPATPAEAGFAWPSPADAFRTLFDAAQLALQPSGVLPLGEGEALTAESMPSTAGVPDGARAWRLSAPGVTVAPARGPVVFVEGATPPVAAPAHAVWIGWQQAAARAGHAVAAVVVPRSGAGLAAEQACARLDDCLRRLGAEDRVTVVLRFDVAALAYACPALRGAAVREVVIGPMPLWPLPTQAAGEYPLRTLYTLLGWLDTGVLGTATAATWQMLNHPAAATAWPGLVQAAVWQENLARGALPGDATAQALAGLMGPWLVPGIASVLADDWAVRRAATRPEAVTTPLPALRAVFVAEDTEPARIWAGDYAGDLFGALGPALQVSLAMGEALPLPGATRAPAAEDRPAAARRSPPAKKRPAAPDDLTRIEGIGPKIAGLLADAGITRFAQLAEAPASQLQAVLRAAGRRFAMARPDTWAQQADLLARGDIAGFEALTARLRGGVEPG